MIHIAMFASETSYKLNILALLAAGAILVVSVHASPVLETVKVDARLHDAYSCPPGICRRGGSSLQNSAQPGGKEESCYSLRDLIPTITYYLYCLQLCVRA